MQTDLQKAVQKQGLSWEITNIYQLARQTKEGELLPNNEGSHGLTQNNCNFHTSLLVSLIDNRRILLIATQYSSTQINCRPVLSRLPKDYIKIRSLRQVAGRGAEDAYLQLKELQAIEERSEPTKQHCVRYPDTMMQNMHCHIRALWNLSQEAAHQALQQRIRHTDVG